MHPTTVPVLHTALGHPSSNLMVAPVRQMRRKPSRESYKTAKFNTSETPKGEFRDPFEFEDKRRLSKLGSSWVAYNI